MPSFPILCGVEIKPRALCTLGKHPASGDTSPALSFPFLAPHFFPMMIDADLWQQF